MTRSEILEKAKECVTGKREGDYGTPENNFKVIADMWNCYLHSKNKINCVIKPEDVALMMSLMKIAHITTGTAAEDSFVDACGYLACGGELAG